MGARACSITFANGTHPGIDLAADVNRTLLAQEIMRDLVSKLTPEEIESYDLILVAIAVERADQRLSPTPTVQSSEPALREPPTPAAEVTSSKRRLHDGHMVEDRQPLLERPGPCRGRGPAGNVVSSAQF
jgi:hypothetical protein